MAEWTKIFPKQVTEKYTSSVTFMKQLTAVAVSSITYLKNLFPDDCYTVETFGGINMRILKKKCRNELAQFLSTALTRAFEAFDKKYLHQLALCIYDEECKAENLIEYHIFEYTYNSDGVTVNVHSKSKTLPQTLKCTFEAVRESTVQMIRACVVIMQSCQQELPPHFNISLRLYYNEDAPENYQAPGFQSTGEPEDHLASTLTDTVKLGCVETPYHQILARSYIKGNQKSSHEATASQNPPVMTQNVEFLSGSSRRLVADGIEPIICCPCCNYTDEANSMDLLTCFYCKMQQHAICFGVLPERIDRLGLHCCTACSDADPNRQPTDARLASMEQRLRKNLCIFRRTLIWCSMRGEVNSDQLCALGVAPHNTLKLINMLRSYQLLQPADSETPEKVNEEQINMMMEKYFQNSDKQNIVDRLLADTFASQESRPDPVADVLSPMEKVSLQNATKIGRLVEPIKLSTKEDATLKQYREAMLSNPRNDEEMPLAVLGKRNVGRGKRKIEDPVTYVRRTGIRTKRARVAPK